MGNTTFSGPIKIGSNSLNTGWQICCQSFVYDIETDGGAGAGTVGVIGMTSDLWIPAKSQIVDVQMNVEKAFNNPTTISMSPADSGNVVTAAGGAGSLGTESIPVVWPGANVKETGRIVADTKVSSVDYTNFTVTLDKEPSGSGTAAQDVIFSSGKMISVGRVAQPTPGGTNNDRFVRQRGLNFGQVGDDYTGVLFPRDCAEVGNWATVGDYDTLIHMTFYDAAPTRSTEGRVRSMVYYAQNRELA